MSIWRIRRDLTLIAVIVMSNAQRRMQNSKYRMENIGSVSCTLRASFCIVHFALRVLLTYAAIHLHHERAREGPSAGQPGSGRHLAVFLLLRQNRRAGPEWRGQELAVADHGRAGP